MRDSAESLLSEEDPLSRFTARHQVVIWFSVTFYVADLCLDLWACGAHFQAGQARSAWFIFFCILMPNLYAGYKSLQWYLRAHEQTPIRRPAKWIIRVLFFPISPILRYIDALVYGRRAQMYWSNKNFALESRNFEKYMMEIAEVALLRLVIIFLEDAPIVVLNLANLLQSPPLGQVVNDTILPTTAMDPSHTSHEDDPETINRLVVLGSILAKLTCTMTLGVVHYVSCNKMAWHLANTKGKAVEMANETTTPEAANEGTLSGATSHGVSTITGTRHGASTIPRTMRHGVSGIVTNLGPINETSRRQESWETKGVLSWTAEVAIYCWQLMAIGSRVMAYALLWVVHFHWLWVPITLRWLLHALWIYFDVAQMSLVNSIAFGGVYLFSFVTTSPGRQVLRISLYYILTFGEHIIIALLWHYGDPTNRYHDLGLGVMFGGAFGGLFFLGLYYLCCHPDKHDIWLRKWWTAREKTPATTVQIPME